MESSPLDARISSMEHKVSEFRDRAKRMEDTVNNARAGNQNVTRVIIEREKDPGAERRTALLVACVLVAIVAVGVAWDTRSEMRALRVEMGGNLNAERLQREREVQELRSADNVWRAYVNSGRLPAAQARK